MQPSRNTWNTGWAASGPITSGGGSNWSSLSASYDAWRQSPVPIQLNAGIPAASPSPFSGKVDVPRPVTNPVYNTVPQQPIQQKISPSTPVMSTTPMNSSPSASPSASPPVNSNIPQNSVAAASSITSPTQSPASSPEKIGEMEREVIKSAPGFGTLLANWRDASSSSASSSSFSKDCATVSPLQPQQAENKPAVAVQSLPATTTAVDTSTAKYPYVDGGIVGNFPESLLNTQRSTATVGHRQRQLRPKLLIKRLRNSDGSLLRPGARVPTRANKTDAGCDLYVPQFTTTKPENHIPAVAQIDALYKSLGSLPTSDEFTEEVWQKHMCQLSALRDMLIRNYALVPANGKLIVPLGFAANAGIPEDGDDYYLRLAPKSGVAAKQTIDIGAGVGDETYRQEYGLITTNYGAEPQLLIAGKSAGQMIMERIRIPDIVEVDDFDESGARAGGFGSSGTGVGEGSLQATLIGGATTSSR